MLLHSSFSALSLHRCFAPPLLHLLLSPPLLSSPSLRFSSQTLHQTPLPLIFVSHAISNSFSRYSSSQTLCQWDELLPSTTLRSSSSSTCDLEHQLILRRAHGPSPRSPTPSIRVFGPPKRSPTLNSLKTRLRPTLPRLRGLELSCGR